MQPFFYTLRPLVQNPKQPLKLEYVNLAIQVVFDAFVWYMFGGRMLAYLLLGSMLAMGIHPVAGHFISEHYMFDHGFETYSYYGPLNWLTFHVGYHNEHHDFPSIPGSRLAKVRKPVQSGAKTALRKLSIQYVVLNTKYYVTQMPETCIGLPDSGTRNEKNPIRLKPEIGSGLKTNFFRVRVGFRVSTFLFGSGSGWIRV